MAVAAPVAIGTRGTVASLVRKEIEFFTKSHGSCNNSSIRSLERVVDDDGSAASIHHSRPSLWSLMRISWRRKKRRGSSGGNNIGFLPRMCSVVEVAETESLNGIPGFSYRILKEDTDHFQT